MKKVFDFKREYNIYCEERGLGKRITNRKQKEQGKRITNLEVLFEEAD